MMVLGVRAGGRLRAASSPPPIEFVLLRGEPAAPWDGR
jgi:hypothetical protein